MARGQGEMNAAPSIILVEPQMGENIGMAARAMANFGLSDLRLVRPHQAWPNPRAKATASGADQVIDDAKLFDSVEASIADLNYVLATTARRRDTFQEIFGADEAARRCGTKIAAGGKAGILFGRERWGLQNEEVALAQALVTLPVDPRFASLNIAQAVVVVAYEWRKVSTLGALPFSADTGTPATHADVEGLVGHFEAALDRAGFFPTEDKRPSMARNLRTLLTRAGFNAQEIRTLRGAIASLERKRED